jgi:hypothetical protein
MSGTTAVNEHYLDRIVAVADRSGVEATEDIVAGNGMKLVAKGGRIDARVRDRLLAHKLLKPLASMLRVVDAAGAMRLDMVAEQVLDTSPLVAAVGGRGPAKAVVAALRHLHLSTPVESLLAVYREDSSTRLPHAVAVTLLAGSMIHDLTATAGPGLQTMLVAGLLHDVGELYIDPAILKPSRRLTGNEMKHIATHPLVAAHLLRDLPGAGATVADLVLHHHERRDGFGYPGGLTAERLSLAAQILGVAEILAGLAEAGPACAERAAVAMKLIPGEFQRALLDRVVLAARGLATGAADGAGARTTAEDPLVARVAGLQATLQAMDAVSGRVAARAARSGPELRALAAHAVERCGRIARAFSSTGLDVHASAALARALGEMDGAARHEAEIVVRELEWRLREVKREVRRRAERLAEPEHQLVLAMVDEAKACVRQALGEVRPLGEEQAVAA